VTVTDVLDWLDRLAPFESQEDYDNTGLLVGNPASEITRVLFALDVTPAVIREAQASGSELIVTHHPLMFTGIRHIRYDEPEGATLRALVDSGLNLIAAHTNLDRAVGGTGDSLAAALGLTGIAPAGKSVYLRCGALPQAQTAGAFLRQVDTALHTYARLYGNPETMVTRAVVGPGASGEEYSDAAAAKAQVFVVGEIKHHQLLSALALCPTVIEAGHFRTELPGITALYKRFSEDALTHRWPVEARLSDLAPFDCTIA
jgi:GTP cyclohydrolase I